MLIAFLLRGIRPIKKKGSWIRVAFHSLLFASLPGPCLPATTQHIVLGNWCLHAADRASCYIKPTEEGWLDVILCYSGGSTTTRLTLTMPQSPNDLNAAYVTLRGKKRRLFIAWKPMHVPPRWWSGFPSANQWSIEAQGTASAEKTSSWHCMQIICYCYFRGSLQATRAHFCFIISIY